MFIIIITRNEECRIAFGIAEGLPIWLSNFYEAHLSLPPENKNDNSDVSDPGGFDMETHVIQGH